MAIYCPRCGSRWLRDARVCPACVEGWELVDWRAFDDVRQDARDDDQDWNKLGGSPRYLQGGPPDRTGLRFLFQFTADRVGDEMGDGAECYGLIDEERRGYFLIESH